MTIIEKQAVLKAYTEAVHHGARTHEEAVALAAQRTCLPEETVLEVVWQSDAEASL
jgi:hypothetical protein